MVRPPTVGAFRRYLAGQPCTHPALPIAAGVIALVGCVVGDLFIDAHQVVKAVEADGVSITSLDVLKEMAKDPGGFGKEVYTTGFEAIDLLFYAFAALAAFRLATALGQGHAEPTPVAPQAAPQPDPQG